MEPLPTLRRLGQWGAIAREDRLAAAVVSGVLYLVAGISLGVVARLPAVARGHGPVLGGLALVTVCAAGLAFVAVRSQRTPTAVLHLNQALALAMVGVVVALTGGSASPVWFYIVFPALFTSYFYARPVAVGYLVLCVVVQALPLLYDAGARHQVYLAELICAAPAYVSLGLAIATANRRAGSLRAHAEMQAAEEGALRRVASAVADGGEPERVYALVAREAANLLSADGAAIMRYEAASETLTVVGQWASDPRVRLPPGEPIPVDTTVDCAHVLRDGVARRTEAPRPGSRIEKLGYASTLIVPVRLADRMWGVLVAVSPRLAAFAGEDEQVLLEFSGLLAASISSAEKRARLAEQALSDSLTDLANQRALRARLDAELARGARYGSPVSIAVIDIDHFKEINDTAGHDVGDEMLRRVARAFRGYARAEDTVARVGGDEFAWLMPDTRREEALVAVERARRLIAAAPADPYRLTISAGICDTDSTRDASELLRLADSALYWSKAHGRNQAWIYDPAVVHDLSEQQRAVRLERSQALQGLSALVREREARDPATRQHSERVAGAALALATELGWPRERAAVLSETGLLHDIGRITGAEPPVLAGALGVLPEADLARLRAAAAMSADILEGTLEDDQVGWIRNLYAPAGVSAASGRSGARVPDEGESEGEGAAILTVADAYDLMTAVTPGAPGAALAALERHAGAGIDGRVVEALRALVATGRIGQPNLSR